MQFKGTAGKVIHRLGFKFIVDNDGILKQFVDGNKPLIAIDFDNLKKKFTEVDEEGNEITTKEAISDEEKAELLSAIKAYGLVDTEEAEKRARAESLAKENAEKARLEAEKKAQEKADAEAKKIADAEKAKSTEVK